MTLSGFFEAAGILTVVYAVCSLPGTIIVAWAMWRLGKDKKDKPAGGGSGTGAS
jgi:hypothetical protein